MLLMSPRRRIATIIVDGASKPEFVQSMGEESETGSFVLPEAEGEEEVTYELELAAKDVLAAFEKKDAKALARALCAFSELHEGED